MNIYNVSHSKAIIIYISLREQYLSDRPMTKAEEELMWDAWARISKEGFKWKRIKNHELRENRVISGNY